MSLPLSLAALLIQPAAPPFAAEGVRWVALPAGPTVRTEYDPASIRRVGDRATVTLRNESLANPAAERYIAVMVIDCRERRFGVQAFHVYSPGGAYLRTQERPLAEVELEGRTGGGIDELGDAVCRRE